MTKMERLNFEIYVMDLCDGCQTARDYELLSDQLHQSVEDAIWETCIDNGVKDYESQY